MFADQAACSVAAIRKIEADERRPSRDIAEHLARVLDIPEPQRLAVAALSVTDERVVVLAIATRNAVPCPI